MHRPTLLRLARPRFERAQVELHRLHARLLLHVLCRDPPPHPDEDQVELDACNLHVLRDVIGQELQRGWAG